MTIRTENAKALYLEGIRDGNYVEAIHAYAGERYTQHSTPVKDGKAGFIEFFADFVLRNPDRQIEILRAWEDGQYVFVHALQVLNHGEFRYVTADIFDTDDAGKLIEHWDVIAPWVEPTVSGRTQVDGPTQPTDLDKTEANKALVRRFIDDVYVNGRLDRIADHVGEALHQHDPQVADGRGGLQTFLQRRAAEGQAVRCAKIHRVVGCGDFVAVLSETNVGAEAHAVIDLFRVADGKLAEHWNVAESILPEDQWVNSGKF